MSFCIMALHDSEAQRRVTSHGGAPPLPWLRMLSKVVPLWQCEAAVTPSSAIVTPSSAIAERGAKHGVHDDPVKL